MKALIFENKVVDLIENEFPVADTMQWVDCGSSIKVGYYYIDGEFKNSLKSDSELLQEAKDSKIAQIAINRENLSEKTTVTYNSKTYANSQNARIAIINYKLELDDVATKPYFTYPEKEVVDLNKSDFTQIADLIESNESSLRQQEILLINNINDCTTVAGVNNIDITFS